MYNFIPLIVILLSLAVIITIVVRKFPMLANLDVETIQAEREAKFKEQIIGNRLKKNIYKLYVFWLKIARPISASVGSFFSWAYKKLVDFKDNYNQEKGRVVLEDGLKLSKLFTAAEEFEKAGGNGKAEEKYIEIISLDSKNYEAFKKLAKLYFDRKDFNEAKQTFEHALKLLEHQDVLPVGPANGFSAQSGFGEKNLNTEAEVASIYYELALVCRAMANLEGALANISRALSIEENNPRYLDAKAEISIIKKDKISAKDAYVKLAEVNPENQKLAEFKKQIDEI